MGLENKLEKYGYIISYQEYCDPPNSFGYNKEKDMGISANTVSVDDFPAYITLHRESKYKKRGNDILFKGPVMTEDEFKIIHENLEQYGTMIDNMTILRGIKMPQIDTF